MTPGTRFASLLFAALLTATLGGSVMAAKGGKKAPAKKAAPPPPPPCLMAMQNGTPGPLGLDMRHGHGMGMGGHMGHRGRGHRVHMMDQGGLCPMGDTDCPIVGFHRAIRRDKGMQGQCQRALDTQKLCKTGKEKTCPAFYTARKEMFERMTENLKRRLAAMHPKDDRRQYLEDHLRWMEEMLKSFPKGLK